MGESWWKWSTTVDIQVQCTLLLVWRRKVVKSWKHWLRKLHLNQCIKQESIPVGCVPFAAVTVVEGCNCQGGFVPARECTCQGVNLPGGVPTKGDVYLPGWGVHLPEWIVPARGVPSRGCVPARGVSAPMHAGIHPHGQNSWHTLVKTLPFRNFVCGR